MKKGRGQATGWGQCSVFPSVLSHRWLGDRKDIQPLKTRALCPQRLAEQNMWKKKTNGELASVNEASSVRSPVVYEERSRTGNWLRSVLCVSFSASTLLVG